MLKLLAHLNGFKEFTMKMLNNSGKLLFNFRNTYFSTWKTGTKTSGYFKTVGFLELRTVNNAGHLVPMDQG